MSLLIVESFSFLKEFDFSTEEVLYPAGLWSAIFGDSFSCNYWNICSFDSVFQLSAVGINC